MLAELLTVLRDHFTDQAKVVPVAMPFSSSKRETFFWHPEKKELETIDKLRADTRHRLLSVESIIDYVKAHEESKPTNIWVDEHSITVELVENNESDVLLLEMKFTPLFALLFALKNSPSVPQSQSIRFLRQNFSEFDLGSRALTAVRSLRISSGSELESDQSHVSSKLGKSIMQSAAGANELPEYLDVVTPVYLRAGGVGRPVRVWLSIDFSKTGNILFEPDSTQLEEAMIAERLEIQSSLQESLGSQKVHVYEGKYIVQPS